MSQQTIQKLSIAATLEEHIEAVRATFTPPNIKILEQMAEEIAKAFKRGNKILLCGNGGSAADSQHIAAEFIGRFAVERKSLPAIALTTDTSILTAVGNDYSYDQIFSRQVEGLGKEGDILFAISTSGNSKNVIEAAKKAKDMRLRVFGFSGAAGGALKPLADLCFLAGCAKTPHIQEMHITALHAVSEQVEHILF